MEKYSGYLRRPHYYETDQMGIIHHSNYIRWFEEARVDLLETLNLPYHKIEAQGIIVPVLSVTAEYKNMIRYEDEVRIAVLVDKYTGTRLDFTYEVYTTAHPQLMTIGSSKHCFMNSDTGRLVSLKKAAPAMHEIFATYSTL